MVTRVGYDEAIAAIHANWTPRYYELNELERYADTTQYDDRKVDWLDDSSNIPLWDRRPSVAFPIVANAIASNNDLLIGEGRFPEFLASVKGGQPAKWPELSAMVKAIRFRAVCRQVLTEAQRVGTAVALVGVRAGRQFIETTKAKWCEPKFGVGGELTELEIRYPYLHEVHDRRTGEYRYEARIYRRLLTAESDTTFLPAIASRDSLEPDWVVDPARTVRHGLGFCPAVWYPFMVGTTTVNDIDGNAIHARFLDEIRALDFALSHRHRCAIKLEPQIVEIGVPPGYSPTDQGAAPEAFAAPGPPIDTTSREALTRTEKLGTYNSQSTARPASRKKGPGFPWQYSNPEARVEMLEMSSGALQALSDHATDLRSKLNEALSVVQVDPENLKFAGMLSGKALALLKQRQLDRCDSIREDLAQNFMAPVLRMSMRIAGIQERDFEPKWGPYFKLDMDDERAAIDLAVAAKGGGVATLRMALEKLRSGGVFEINDVESVASELEKAAEEKRSVMLEAAKPRTEDGQPAAPKAFQ